MHTESTLSVMAFILMLLGMWLRFFYLLGVVDLFPQVNSGYKIGRNKGVEVCRVIGKGMNGNSFSMHYV